MNAISGTFVVLVLSMIAASVPAQVPATNPVLAFSPTNYPAFGFAPTNYPGADAAALSFALAARHAQVKEILPLVEFVDVPIQTVIEHLARQAAINYLMVPELLQKWSGKDEPIVSFRLTNVTARDILLRMLALRRIALVEDPVSNIAFIMPASQTHNPLYAGLPAETASSQAEIIPLIQFEDVPITTAIEHLARQAGVDYMIDPAITGMWNGSGPDQVPEPLLSFRVEMVTAWRTLNRLLNVYGLVLVKSPYSGFAHITFADRPWPFLDAALLDTGTNASNFQADKIIPEIQFTDSPLAVVLKELIRQGGLHVELGPALSDTTKPDWPPELSVHWEKISAKHTILVLCELYGLIIVKDDATGTIQIKRYTPKPHHLQLR